MLMLYGGMASPYVARCAMALRAKEVPFELAGPPGGMKSPEFLKISPFGKVPALADGNVSVPESEVICEYIEERFPEHALLPVDLAARTRSRILSRVVDLYLLPSVFALSRQTDATSRDDGLVSAKLAEFSHALDALERYIEAAPYAIGTALTLADCALVPALFHMRRIMPQFVPEPFSERPDLARYETFVLGNQFLSGVLDEMTEAWSELMKRRAAAA